MTITFVGLNHKTAPVALREKVAFPEATLPEALSALREQLGVEEAVILSTCNRTELYAAVSDDVSGFDVLSSFLCSFKQVAPRELLSNLYTADELDAVTHLFNVVSSLDSLVLGEQQILGQVRKAYSIASEQGTTGKELNHLFHQALSVGKEVRSKTEISKNHVSISTVAIELVKRVFEDLESRTVLVLGAGEMGTLTARYLAENNVGQIIVANRTYERALVLANELGGRAMNFDDLQDCLALADIVVASTSAGKYLITPELLEASRKGRYGRSLLLIDIAVPRNIDPTCERLEDVYLYSVDDLEAIVSQNQAAREEAANQAARLVGDEVKNFAGWVEACDVTPTISALRMQADAVKDAELARLFKRVKTLDEKDRASIEAMANAIVSKMLHQPLSLLREEAGSSQSIYHARALRELFALGEKDDAPSKCDGVSVDKSTEGIDASDSGKER